MLKDLFKKSETPEPTQEEITKLHEELKPLRAENEALSKINWDLHCRAMHAEPQDKAAIMTKRAENSHKLTQVRGKIAVLKEKIDKIMLEKLIIERNEDMLIYVNNVRQKIPQDLNVKIPFSCNKHSITLKVYELISYQTTLENCSSGQLLGKWQAMLTGTGTYQRGIMCQQCYKEIREKREKTHSYKYGERTGQATVVIQRIP